MRKMSSAKSDLNRRRFLQQTGGAALAMAQRVSNAAVQAVSIIIDPEDALASSAPVDWATKELESALSNRNIPARRFRRGADAPSGDLRIVVAGPESPAARDILGRAHISIP